MKSHSLMSALVHFALSMMVMAIATASAAQAGDAAVKQFYASQAVTLLIPSGPGGGYDAYGRLVARHLGRHLPGNPAIIPQNKPGAGGIVLANYLANAAPKDGSVIAVMQNGIPLSPLLDSRPVKFKTADFHWLGSVTSVTNIGIVSKSAKAQTAKDLFTMPLTIGASGGVASYVPLSLKKLLGAKLNIVRGYKGTNEIFLAVERGEVDGLFGVALDSFRQNAASRSGDIRILFQAGIKRNKELANIPLIQEFAKSEFQKQVLGTVFASFQIGRLLATNECPPERLAALRKAIVEMMADPQFISDAKKLRLDVNPQTYQEIDDIVAEVQQRPENVIKESRTIMADSQ